MSSIGVMLWWIGEGAAQQALLTEASRRVAETYAVDVRTADAPARPVEAFDPRRKQWASSRVLGFLADRRPPDAERLLGVTDSDLFIPILTFVFGEAQLKGRVAVVSTARLGHGPRLPKRLATECVHELGHTWGLLHCGEPRCAMARSVSLLHVDGKDCALCPECRERWEEIKCNGTYGGPDEQAQHADPDRR